MFILFRCLPQGFSLFRFCTAILALSLYFSFGSATALAQEEPLSASVAGEGPGSNKVGTQWKGRFSAAPEHAPTPGSECTVTGSGTPGPWSGPSWDWNVEITPKEGSPAGGLTAKVLDPKDSSSVDIEFNFVAPGNYSVKVMAGVTYKSSCGDKSGGGYVPFDVTVWQRVWSPEPGIEGGEMTSPQNQTASPATPETLIANVGSSVTCTVGTATDKDSWWEDHNGNGSKDEDETDTEDEDVNYKWSIVGPSGPAGSFDNDTSPSTTLHLPNLPGAYTLMCKINDAATPVGTNEGGSRDDEAATPDKAITRTFAITVLPYYSLVWNEGQTPVAAGAKATSAHQAIFTLTVKAGDGSGVPNYTAPTVEILSGGRGGKETTTAHIDLSSTATDSAGNVTGTFTSGNRTEQTVIGILKKAGDKSSGAVQTLNINQVWSDLSVADSWTFDPYFSYNSPSPITFKAQFTRNGAKEDINSHEIEFVTTRITGVIYHTDGSLEPFDYTTPSLLNGYLRGSSGPKRTSLVQWQPTKTSSPTGSYTVNQTIVDDDNFAVDTVEFDASDNDSFDKDGDN